MTTHVHGPSPRQRARRRWLTGGLSLAGIGLASLWFGQAGAQSAPAPLLNKAGATAIPDHYIVVLKDTAANSAMASAQTMARGAGGKIGFTYNSVLHGFSVEAPATVIDQLRKLPDVAYVEVDAIIEASSTIESPVPLGLDRLAHRLLPLNNMYEYSQTGTGVHAYVIDTGIRATHTDFGGRASGAFTAIADGNGTNDCHGHGTHVAGTLGGNHYGVAKNVTLHGVRVLDCTGHGPVSGVISGVDWVTANAVFPAVANMSLGGGFSTALNTAVANSIAAGIPYAIAAGNSASDACGASPASVPDAITVGNVDPTNDTQAIDSNFGPCVDLYGPGENIESDWWTSDTAINTISGTSMASPHVAGSIALYLETHPAASPAAVRSAIMTAADQNPGTAGWPGIVDLTPGSPDVLLHWGPSSDGTADGDPHLKTVEGIKYNFQPAGEFTLLRDGNGLEIQTRQTPVQSSWHIDPDAYTGLGGCVSINTAVAARVNGHRVSFQSPPVKGDQRVGSMELRVDGSIVLLGSNGLSLGAGGRLIGSLSGGIQVDFPDGSTLTATPVLWPTMNLWYLDVSVTNTPATEGLIGARAPGSWLPALPDGTSLGPIPASLHQRYLDLNTKFGDAWRVTSATSLFDYASGTSTATFTIPNWPPEGPPCTIPGSTAPVVNPVDLETARQICSKVRDPDRLQNCIEDVRVTGEAGFAQIHQLSEQIETGATSTLLDDASSTTLAGSAAKFTATVAKNVRTAGTVPTGTAQLVVDGVNTGAAVALDARGQVAWSLTTLGAGTHQVRVRYAPTSGSAFLASQSLPISHVVK